MVLNFYLPMWTLLKARAQLSHVLVREAQVEADGGSGEWGGGPLPSHSPSRTPAPRLPWVSVMSHGWGLVREPRGSEERHLHVSGELLAQKDHQSYVTRWVSYCLNYAPRLSAGAEARTVYKTSSCP